MSWRTCQSHLWRVTTCLDCEKANGCSCGKCAYQPELYPELVQRRQSYFNRGPEDRVDPAGMLDWIAGQSVGDVDAS